jgi:hypothetical protein
MCCARGKAEFQDLGVAKVAGRSRGSTAGRRRAGAADQAPAVRRGADDRRARAEAAGRADGAPPASPELDDLLSSDVRERILSVRQSLRELSAMLAQGREQRASSSWRRRWRPAAAEAGERRRGENAGEAGGEEEVR